MNQTGITPVKLALTEGDFYTLWAPSWKEHGQEWQAFLGSGDRIYTFESPAAMLVFLRSGAAHDLTEHPKWEAFNAGTDDRVLPTEYADIIGVPHMLAGKPTKEHVNGVAQAFSLARSLADVAGATTTQSFFASHSVVHNVFRGADHYSGEGGPSEWTAVGRAVESNWDHVVDDLDTVAVHPDVPADEVAAAERDIELAEQHTKEDAAAREKAVAAAAAEVDPYDVSAWSEAGIDPIKITIGGRSLYTLRTYLDANPIFLGKYGEIFTFSGKKTMLRWLVEHEDHDLARVSTWPEIMDGVNGGTLDIDVHPDNVYNFTGLEQDIKAGPDEVDAPQMKQAYELMADAADWANDDGVNSVLVANPELQNYIGYVAGSQAGYAPSAPYTGAAEGWHQLEQGLVKRFSRS